MVQINSGQDMLQSSALYQVRCRSFQRWKKMDSKTCTMRMIILNLQQIGSMHNNNKEPFCRQAKYVTKDLSCNSIGSNKLAGSSGRGLKGKRDIRYLKGYRINKGRGSHQGCLLLALALALYLGLHSAISRW